jgi:pimeloyl-ACP methyl ester carboxylesterase
MSAGGSRPRPRPGSRPRPRSRRSFVLIPGAGGSAWYWHRVAPLLERAWHEAIAVDLPGDDEACGLPAYTDRVVDAIGAREDVVLVAQSLGGFTAALVCARVRVGMLVFVNAMIPVPGETPGAWWGNTGSEAARLAAARSGGYGAAFDIPTYFLHDVPPKVLAAGEGKERGQAGTVFADACDFKRWPDVPIHVIAGRDDRFFPVEFQRQVAQERLRADVDEIAGGHLVALSKPRELAAQLLGYVRGRGRAGSR